MNVDSSKRRHSMTGVNNIGMENQKKIRALVISGGGSKGAFAGGLAAQLLQRNDYQVFVGTSAGSLLIPLLALGEVERLKNVFTNIRQRDIFNICPFILKWRHGEYTYRINHFNTVRMFLRGKKTFGESENLRRLIHQTFTQKDYQRLRASNKDVVVTVSNLSCYQVEYKSVHDCSYEDFCDWMWISANIVPFMSLVKKNGMEYADGGLGNYLPLQEAIRRGACTIDAIILKPKENMLNCYLPVTNAFSLLSRAFDFMLQQISFDDLALGHLESMHRRVELFCYHTPRLLTENSFIFNPDQMAAWWQEGKEYYLTAGPTCHAIEQPIN
ncbi:MAG TPA: patatin-like phospholipase family protein [Saprospiraceae bacterium]|nr:patatin-like phospholipase family protein [Saprospiraceae bacterium]HMP26089.1 patatin-like phospholipase family protein [Saprospiraceae bacterium]